MNIYIHTIDNQPGEFDGDQVCYAGWGRTSHSRKPAYSLRQIKREQKKSMEFRADMFGEKDQSHRYGYVRYSV